MDPEQTVCRELMLIKVGAGSDTRSQVLEGANVFRAKVVRSDADHRHHGADRGHRQAGRVHHLPGTLSSILETCRTGITAIGRGEYMLKQNEEE